MEARRRKAGRCGPGAAGAGRGAHCNDPVRRIRRRWFREGEMPAGAVLVRGGFEIDAGAGPASGARLRGDRGALLTGAIDSRRVILTK